MSNIVDWNPEDGVAVQGDVVLFRLPEKMKVDTTDEINPQGERLILAEGEITGHHHAITIERPVSEDEARAMVDAVVAANRRRKKAAAPSVRMYRDLAAVASLARAGLVTTDNLCIGFLMVDTKPVVLRHEEHEAIRIPPGRYYVGRQREWSAAEERRIAD